MPVKAGSYNLHYHINDLNTEINPSPAVAAENISIGESLAIYQDFPHQYKQMWQNIYHIY